MVGGKYLKENKNLMSVSEDVKGILEALERDKARKLSIYERICRFSNGIFGRATGGMNLTDETKDRLSWAGIRVTPSEWWSGFVMVLLVPVLLSLLLLSASVSMGLDLLSLWYVPLLGLGISSLLGGLFYYYPASAADVGRTKARSKAIETIMLMSFSLHHSPDLRGAAVFAGTAGEGKLSKDLGRGLLELDQKGNYETVRQLFVVIAQRWGEIDEGVRKAIFDILRSTGEKDESLRRQDVSKAPERVIDSAERELNSQLDSLIMPTLTFMIFGSLSIVGLVGLSPIFGMIGVGFIDLKFFVLVSALLIAAFLSFTVLIESRRPVTVPPPRIPSEISEIPPEGKVEVLGRFIPTLFPSLLLMTVISLPGVLYLAGISHSSIISGPNTLWIVWGVGGGLSLYSHLRVGPRLGIREKAYEATDDWAMSFNAIGSRVMDGCPMKRAMEETSALLSDGKVGDTLGQATEMMNRFSVDQNYAFFETGLYEKIYSPLVASFLDVITKIRKDSEESAGRAMMMAGEFLETLRDVERKFKERISDASSNLWLMAVVLLPVVCALSVWIIDFMGEISISTSEVARNAGLANLPILSSPMESMEVSILKLIMGMTVIFLNLIVVRHISVIEVGRDRIKLWSMVPKAVLPGTAVFTLSYYIFGFISVIGV
ncbi:MAG: hypothetical protein ACOCTL_03555 [Candidatus Hadarchaeota archaeon]